MKIDRGMRVSERVARMNPGIFGEGRVSSGSLPVAVPKRASQLEDRYFNGVLAGLVAGGVTVIRQFRLRVSEWDAPVLVHYTADFAIFRKSGSSFQCDLHEVKDDRRKPHSNELTSAKLVKHQHPWINAVWVARWDGERWAVKQIA